MSSERTTPTPATKEADRREADVEHDADRPPTPTEAEKAPEEVSEETAEAYKEMTRRGAEQEGEGRLP